MSETKTRVEIKTFYRVRGTVIEACPVLPEEDQRRMGTLELDRIAVDSPLDGYCITVKPSRLNVEGSDWYTTLDAAKEELLRRSRVKARKLEKELLERKQTIDLLEEGDDIQLIKYGVVVYRRKDKWKTS